MNNFIVDKLSIAIKSWNLYLAFLSYLFLGFTFIYAIGSTNARTAKLVFAVVAISMQH